MVLSILSLDSLQELFLALFVERGVGQDEAGEVYLPDLAILRLKAVELQQVIVVVVVPNQRNRKHKQPFTCKKPYSRELLPGKIYPAKISRCMEFPHTRSTMLLPKRFQHKYYMKKTKHGTIPCNVSVDNNVHVYCNPQKLVKNFCVNKFSYMYSMKALLTFNAYDACRKHFVHFIFVHFAEHTFF